MAYKTVEVDIDLDEFDLDELSSEICRRLRRNAHEFKKLKANKYTDLCAVVEELAEALNITFRGLPTDTMEDQMKIEHLAKVWDKYRSYEFERALA